MNTDDNVFNLGGLGREVGSGPADQAVGDSVPPRDATQALPGPPDTQCADPTKWRFGDLIENGWASDDNPTKFGFFVRLHKCQGLPAVETTDGLGKFSSTFADKDHKLKRIGLSAVGAL